MRTLILLLLAAPLAALAETPTHGIEITPFAGYIMGGSFDTSNDANGETQSSDTVDLEDAGSFGLIVNWPADPNTEWEIYASRQSTSLKPGGLFVPGEDVPQDLDITFIQAGGTYLFEGERAHPFIVATIGASRFEPTGDFDSETFFAFTIGGGYKVAATNRLGLRLEGRVLGTVINSDQSVFCRSNEVNSGCLIAVQGSVLWQWEVSAGLIFRL